jgi:hypothetical protein
VHSHIVGGSQFSGGEASSSPSHETSLVVLQFVELVRGVRQVHKPGNGFQTVSVKMEERYCMGCFGMSRHDVWSGVRPLKGTEVSGFKFQVSRCRVCGKEGE